MPPSMLTPARHEAIVKLVREGAFIEQACAAVGIASRTFREWRQRGEDPDEKDPRYARFAEDCAQARALAEQEAIDLIRMHARNDYKAAAFFLERSFPDRWGEKSRTDVTSGGNPLKAPVFTLPLVEFREVLTGRAELTEEGEYALSALEKRLGIESGE